MIFQLLVSVLFSRTPYHPYIGGHYRWAGSTKDLILVHTVQLKPMIKAHISGRTISSNISDVAFASVYSDKTHLKKLIMIIIIIIMNKSQETMVFSGCQKLTSPMKLRPEK